MKTSPSPRRFPLQTRRTSLLSRLACLVILFGLFCPRSEAGPNAGGTLLIHDAGLTLSATDGDAPVCGQGSVPAECAGVDAEIDGASASDPAVFRVYAAFPDLSSPRLMGVTWGVGYDSTRVHLIAFGMCGDFELNDYAWPAPGAGSTVVWNQPRTAQLTAVYWFAGYGDGTGETFDLIPHPDQGGWFGDDAVPAHLDAIAGYGKLGFDVPGEAPCPEPIPTGACCAVTGACTVTTQENCLAPAIWHGDWPSCEPNPCPHPGACCGPQGTCRISLPQGCVPPEVYHGEWTSCVPNPCPQPLGACCYTDGTCLVSLAADCPTGEWLILLPCEPNPCPQTGACCHPDGACELTFEDQCDQQWLGPDSTCQPNPCPQPGACCNPADGTCIEVLEAACLFPRVWQGPNTGCIPNPCPQPVGACCAPDGSCAMTTPPECVAPGTWHASWTTCEPNPCPQPGACCLPDGTCLYSLQPSCAGLWLGAGTICDPNPCPEVGACCAPNGQCTITPSSSCDGEWMGPGTSCVPTPCPQPAGACCLGGNCTVVPLAQCSGTWLGAGTDCDPNPCCQGAPSRTPRPAPDGRNTLASGRAAAERGSHPDAPFGPRVGGDTIGQAALISSLPFSDTGGTCGFANDYDECCPYQGSTSADVVYRYTPTSPLALTLDLCASIYDTKIYVYAGGLGNLVGCNDDAGCGYSGWQSKIANLSLEAGVDYYIVIDGYGGACGTYVLQATDYAPCVVNCPTGGFVENEPPCGPNYVDNYNGGCNASPNAFQPLGAASGGCVDLCGKSGTYIFQGLSYRDTDWFECYGVGATATLTCTAEFPVQVIFIYNADCNNLQYDIGSGGDCQPVTLSHYMASGVRFWLWVGPQVFTGIPCDADYLLNVCGIQGGSTPVETMSWGKLKSLYR